MQLECYKYIWESVWEMKDKKNVKIGMKYILNWWERNRGRSWFIATLDKDVGMVILLIQNLWVWKEKRWVKCHYKLHSHSIHCIIHYIRKRQPGEGRRDKKHIYDKQHTLKKKVQMNSPLCQH